MLCAFQKCERFTSWQQLAPYPLKQLKAELKLGVFNALLAAGWEIFSDSAAREREPQVITA